MSMSSPLPLGCNHHFHKRSFATLQQRLAHTKYLLIGEVTSNDVAITNISRETNNRTDSEECVRSLHTTDEESKIETESETSMMHETPRETESVQEEVENEDDDLDVTLDSNDYLDFEFVLKRCRDQRQAKQASQKDRLYSINVNKTERKRHSAVEARIARQALDRKKREEKRRKKGDDQSRMIRPIKPERERKREQPQSCGDGVGVIRVVCSSSSRVAQHVQLVPTQHIVNQKNLASGINERLLELQGRDLTPEDYDLLLTLDDLVARPTVNPDVLERLPTHTAMEDDQSDACGVCIDAYKMGDDITTLPCDHRFHSQCINQWLRTVSNRCPLDGNKIV